MLREAVLAQAKSGYEQRQMENPYPTDEECRIGRFLEQLEYQVRDAVLVLNRKGYRTEQSGFSSIRHDEQFLTIDLGADEILISQLLSMGIGLNSDPFGFMDESDLTYIWFQTPRADLDEIKQAWDLLASKFPDRGRIADKSPHPLARFFRIKFAESRWPNEMEELKEDAKHSRIAESILTRINEQRAHR